MIRTIYKYLSHNFHHPNYFLLMVSLILSVLIPPFTELFDNGGIIINILYGITMLMAVIYTTTNIRELIIFFIIGLIGFFLFIINTNHNITLEITSALLNFSFFVYVFIKLIRFLIKEKQVDVNTIFACISGFFILGISSSLLFSLLNSVMENAFNLPEDPNFYDFIYFSFVTLTTVGFGDITPSSGPSKSLTIMLGIVGQLYTTFLVAIIVGKYLATETFSNQ